MARQSHQLLPGAPERGNLQGQQGNRWSEAPEKTTRPLNLSAFPRSPPCFRNTLPRASGAIWPRRASKPCALAPLSALLPPQEAFLKNPGLIMAAGSCFHMALGRLHVRPAADGYSCLNTACAITWISLCGCGRPCGMMPSGCLYSWDGGGVTVTGGWVPSPCSSTLSHGPTLLHKAARALS